MALTSAQLATLKANILTAFPTAPNSDDANFDIAVAYNLPATPVFRVWRTAIPTKEVKQNVIWTEFIGRTQGERDAFQFMLQDGFINGADTNIRQGITDIFSGVGGATSRSNLTALSKRDASRIEKLFAVGTGTDASPATMAFEGPISYQTVAEARAI